MGRGRKGLLEQSQKKPKRPVETKKKGEVYWWHGVGNQDKKNSMFLTNDFLEAIKRMEPKEVADIIFKNENPQSVC